MTLTATKTIRRLRPPTVTATIAFLLALGVGAVGGGWVMLSGIGGASMLPDDYLDMIPVVNSWVIPGLILMIGFGFGSLVTTYGLWRRPTWAWLRPIERMTGHQWPWIATLLLGLGQVTWITIELLSIPFSALMPTFGLVGLMLFVLPMTASVRRYLNVR